MFKRFLPISLLIFCVVVISNWGCTKLDTTTLGSDLIPAVDNVNTFSTTLDIEATQGLFTDSFKILRSENNVLGFISDDPLFGKTEANLFLQFKPGFYPYYFGNAGDTTQALDSVVLCLSYNGSWGDTTQPQTLTVYRITDNEFGDSSSILRDISYQPALGASIGSRTINLNRIGKDTIKIGKSGEPVLNQIRIKLDQAYANELWSKDSTRVGPNNAFLRDSLYRKFNRGFAIKSGGSANALMYISLLDAKTRLEVHFKKKTKDTGKLDTVYTSFTIATADGASMIPSSTANYIKRDYTGSEVANPDPTAIYLQTGPGTFANLRFPGLNAFKDTNRIIHRAQISIEQIPEDDRLDSIFSVPPYMYLDLVDTPSGANRWKPIYYDLNPNIRYNPDDKTGFGYFPNSGEIDYGYFGGYARKKTNALGDQVYYYDINVTRYLQQMVTDKTPNYTMRLFPGFRVQYPQYPSVFFPTNGLPLDNPLAFGRIKVKGGNYPDPDKKVKMRMTVIWSKIN